MSLLNKILRSLTDLVMTPFLSLPAWVSLVLFSFLAAVVALLVYKRFSDQEALKRVKDRISGAFFEIRLFNDDLRAIARAQFDLLRHNLVYLALNLVPLLVMTVPMVLVLAQLQFHYGYRGLEPEKPTVVSLALAGEGEADPAAPAPRVELRAPDGVRVETAPVWIPVKREMSWRVAGEEPGRYDLVFQVEDAEPVSKTLLVADDLQRRSPVRHGGGFLDQLLYPAEDPISPQTRVREIRLGYPEADVEILGLGLHWILWFLILSIVFAFMIRGRMGVTF